MLFELKEHEKIVTCAKFHHSKNLIVSSSWDYTIKVWDFGRLVQKMKIDTESVTDEDIEIVADVELYNFIIN